jgi:hypothetical protein
VQQRDSRNSALRTMQECNGIRLNTVEISIDYAKKLERGFYTVT